MITIQYPITKEYTNGLLTTSRVVTFNLAEVHSRIIDKNNVLVKTTKEDIIEYNNAISNSEFNVQYINGVNMTPSNHILYNCDYCMQEIDSSGRYYCMECKKDMCMSCFEREFCDGHPIVSRKPVEFRENFDIKCCDCNKIVNTKFYFSCQEQIETYYCDDCIDEETLSLRFPSINVQKHRSYLHADNCNFGSMFDWVPIFKKCTSEMLILYNTNTDQFAIYDKDINIISLKNINLGLQASFFI